MKCPFCAEEIQDEAKVCKHCGKNIHEGKAEKSVTVGCLVILAVVVIGYFSFCRGDNPSTQSVQEPARISIGENGILSAGSAGEIPVAVDVETLDASNKAAVANDIIGYRKLFAEGRMFIVGDKTRILVIDSGLAKTRVRILDGPHAGKSGWVTSEWAKR